MDGAVATMTSRSRLAFALLAAAGLALLAGFAALGVWQLERRAWKLDLIERVERRTAAPPVPAPGPGAWPRITRENAEYLRVRAAGRFLHGREALVRAATGLGSGFWVMTPLATDRGFIVLINRGFKPDGPRGTRREAGIAGPAAVTGLLRLTEPGGAFLRPNDPAADRWRSRDVRAIARARGLERVAPYFIDADAAPDPGGYPRGGLTRVRFRNHHLIYALTWFALAGLAAAGLALLARHGRERGR